MLLLLADTILLIFITLTLGILTREILARIFRIPLHADLLELFFLGLLSSSFYFNLLSFWLPVNYWTLIPLGLAGIGVTVFYREHTRAVSRSIRQNVAFFFSSSHWPATIIIGIVLFTYWILPCGTGDSYLYHIQSVLWYEKFKVVPGLANLNGRLAFNPASFLIESAYSFTGPVGQSLYPLNGAAALFIFSWLLLRVFRSGRSLISLAYAALIILVYRHTLVTISSSTSDTMSMVCMVYVLVRLAEYGLSPNKNLTTAILPILIALFGIIIKPATFALLLALPYLFFTLPQAQKRLSLLFKLALFALLIYLPWIGRNYILSGYLVFPFSATGWFHPDWKVPRDVITMEINYIKIVPKVEGDWSPESVARARTLLGWFIPWVRSFGPKAVMDTVFLFMALLSPFYWLIRLRWQKTRSPLLLPWAIAFVATLLWMQASPVFRFGCIYVYMSFMLPLFDLALALPASSSVRTSALLTYLPRVYPGALLLPLLLAGTYYIHSGFGRETTYPFTLADCWLRPLKPIWYHLQDNKDFPYRVLKNGTKMYVSDHSHGCIVTCLPCMEFDYGEIDMRGTRLDEGFRNVKDEVKLHYPIYVQ